MFEKIETSLANADVICRAAELHGTMCGMLVGNISFIFEKWLREMIDFRIEKNSLSSEHLALLRSLFLESSARLQTGDLSFQILLPSDEADYQERVQALSEWCMGFVYGVGVNQTLCISELSEQNQVFISTVSELSLGIDCEVNENDDSEDEKSYAQMVEYLCVGVLSLNDDARAMNAAAVVGRDRQ